MIRGASRIRRSSVALLLLAVYGLCLGGCSGTESAGVGGAKELLDPSEVAAIKQSSKDEREFIRKLKERKGLPVSKRDPAIKPRKP